MTRILRAAALCTAVVLSACYRYVPVSPEAIPKEMELRVFLSRGALSALPSDIPAGVNYITGRLERETSDSLLLMVPVSRTVDGPGARDLRQNVFVSRADVVDVQLRELHRSKTALAFLSGLGVAFILVQAADQGANEPVVTDGLRAAP
jgi:hypothetical protein